MLNKFFFNSTAFPLCLKSLNNQIVKNMEGQNSLFFKKKTKPHEKDNQEISNVFHLLSSRKSSQWAVGRYLICLDHVQTICP